MTEKEQQVTDAIRRDEVLHDLKKLIGDFWVVGGHIRHLLFEDKAGMTDIDIILKEQKPIYRNSLPPECDVLDTRQSRLRFFFRGKYFDLLKYENPYPTINEALTKFDYNICQYACDGNEFITLNDTELMGYVRPTADLLKETDKFRLLRSLLRLGKYVSYGYNVSNKDVLTLIDLIHKAGEEGHDTFYL